MDYHQVLIHPVILTSVSTSHLLSEFVPEPLINVVNDVDQDNDLSI
jgi:hypothetical protein